MPQPYDYFGLMGGAANLGGINDAVQQSILGQQQIQQNQGILAAKAREDAAREAMAKLLLRDQQPQANGALGLNTLTSGRVPGASVDMSPEQSDDALIATIAAHDPAAAQSIIAQREFKTDLAGVLQNPTPQGIASFNMRHAGKIERAHV